MSACSSTTGRNRLGAARSQPRQAGNYHGGRRRLPAGKHARARGSRAPPSPRLPLQFEGLASPCRPEIPSFCVLAALFAPCSGLLGPAWILASSPAAALPTPGCARLPPLRCRQASLRRPCSAPHPRPQAQPCARAAASLPPLFPPLAPSLQLHRHRQIPVCSEGFQHGARPGGVHPPVAAELLLPARLQPARLLPAARLHPRQRANAIASRRPAPMEDMPQLIRPPKLLPASRSCQQQSLNAAAGV